MIFNMIREGFHQEIIFQNMLCADKGVLISFEKSIF